ncbi:hypothetical protein I7G59_00670 [Sinorhizobium meliloti]|uniref:hypothetical protein n=1 Tax=Rhizobium meliloti TaxID=382 RepID=UPI002380C37C|nr:hypothetical protein [Sinorhizobium meliloti]MDE3795845.1 hypothetical protein [Sinorhizobium meliloti]
MRKVLFALPLVAATAAALAAGVPATSGTGWSEEEIALARSLSLEALPPDRTNPQTGLRTILVPWRSAARCSSTHGSARRATSHA